MKAREMRKWSSWVLPVVVLMFGLPVPAGAEPGGAVPSVFPVPQWMKPRGDNVKIPSEVTVVAGAATDEAALGVVDTVLRDAGARTIHRAAQPRQGDRLTVFVAGVRENPATADALRRLGIRDAVGLPAEGYVLASGIGRDGRAHIVLDGVDATGTFYAAQTLRQLVTGSRIRGVEIRDWPSLRWRGVVEGFYGPPWTDRQRLADFAYFGRHKMNTYLYGAKDDAYLRAEWRQPYPADRLAGITELVRQAKANHVEFGYVLSPGLSVCYSRPSEADALIGKLESIWAIGVRSFVIAFDDIDYQRWNCDEDRAEFGTGAAAAGKAQAHLLNQVQRDFVLTHPGALPMQAVPTEYWGTAETGYTKVIAAELDPAVIVQWTGLDVIAPRITRADVDAVRDVYAHPIQIWDNYPVNDYVTSRLLLGPFTGREQGLPVVGLTANPMPQAEASKTSLFTVADFSWNDKAYDPWRSFAAGLSELAGGDHRVAAALRVFADVHHSSRLDPVSGPLLSSEIKRFWSSWSQGDGQGLWHLRKALSRVREAPDVLRARLGNPGFLTETKPWLDATRAWGKAALTALDMLTAQHRGRVAESRAARQALPGLIAEARSFTWTGLDPTRPVRVETDPGLSKFVREALAENARWLGLPSPSPLTDLPPLDDRFPMSNMVDGDPETYFWGAAAARPGNHVGVDLGKAFPLTGVEVLMSKSDSPEDYIHAGVVEYSADGVSWTTGPSFTGKPELAMDLSGVTARFVRLRATEAQDYWVVVREFTVNVAA